MSRAIADELAEFSHRLRRADLPESAAGHAGTLILDAVGCALDGWAAEETPRVLRAARQLGAAGGAVPAQRTGSVTVIGSAVTEPPVTAVLANAYLTTAMTECDVYRPAHCHLTPEVVPAALAVAEAERASGSALLVAVAAGLEVASRLLRALDYPAFRQRGWHSPGVFGPVGAAIAAGRLLGLDGAGLRTAMSLAVSQAAGTFAAWPTTAVKFHQARGAMAGLLAARLAAEGFGASADPFTAQDGGLYRSYAPGDPDVVLDALGARWELEQIALRMWPGAAPVQALLTALLATGRRVPAAREISSVEIAVCPATYQAHEGVAHPAGCFEALLSFHYVAAAALINGTFDVSVADPAHRGGVAIAEFTDEHVKLTADSAVPVGGVHVTITGNDGSTTTIRQNHALGSPELPATIVQVSDKFGRAAQSRLAPAAAEELLRMLRSLDNVADCAELAALTRGSPAPVSAGTT